ncbi:phage prohead protease, HK97 family [Fulvimarina manganoxydans]|uniref:Phage prohead protease, HK97 family n=1 Tax=Fulvimarina manganoxydans TaxID=937218 RepID=A0A1W2AD44_9HYPH|nr:HK97 family phage prohead protease [Fulvimarina manganoxydans]SMC58168.1 phage prohead protease, HK97 family [Fulvimarina manganoxydans]
MPKKTATTVTRKLPTLGLRAAVAAPATWNDETLTVTAVLATNAPVRMYDWDNGQAYDEILDVDALTPEQLAAFEGAPVLDSHDRWTTKSIVGRVETPRVEDGPTEGIRALVSEIRFSPTETDLIAKVKAGFVRAMSLGYGRLGAVAEEREGDVVLVRTQFDPAEVSAVAVPADRGAGIRGAERSASTITLTTKGKRSMDAEKIKAAMKAFTDAIDAALEDDSTTEDDAAKEEAARAAAAAATRSAPAPVQPQAPAAPQTPAAPAAGVRSEADQRAIAGYRAIAATRGKTDEFDTFANGGSAVPFLRSLAEGYVAGNPVEIDGTGTTVTAPAENTGRRGKGAFITHAEAVAGKRASSDADMAAAIGAAIAGVLGKK